MPVSQSISVPYVSNVTNETCFGIGIGAHYDCPLESRAAMDLLEYQGKQLFARHGLRVSDGRAVKTVDDAVVAADELGYPVVVKAQVLIGGRGKAGGVKLA